MTTETPDEDLSTAADALVSRMLFDGWAKLTGQQAQRALEDLEEAITCEAVDRATWLLEVLRDAARRFERLQEQQWEHYKAVKAQGYPEEMGKGL